MKYFTETSAIYVINSIKMNQSLISDLNQATAAALNPDRSFTVRLEPELTPLRCSLIKRLYQLGTERIETGDEDGAEDVIGDICYLTDDEGFYTFEVVWTEQEDEVSTSYRRHAIVAVKIYADNEEGGSSAEYEFDQEDGEVFQLHLKHAGYPESGVITGNIISDLG